MDDYVQSGMIVGLGTGSTAYFAVERGTDCFVAVTVLVSFITSVLQSDRSSSLVN